MKRGAIITFVLIFVVAGYFAFDWYMRSVFSVLAKEQSTKVLSNCINDAAYQVIKKGVSYEDLIDIKLDEKGNVVMVQSDTMAMNLLGSEVSSLAEQILDAQTKKGVRIPFGYLVGGQIFSEVLPEVVVNYRQIGNATATFSSEFKSAGINQTIHTVNMNVGVDTLVMIPNYNKEIRVEVTLPVCETIIVGTVPQDYMNLIGKYQ